MSPYLPRGLMCISFLAAMLWAAKTPAAQFEIPPPPGSGAFGARVAVLPNGNIVVTDPEHADQGAVYLFSPGGQMISKLTGSPQGAGGQVYGWQDIEITVLANGNYVIGHRHWNQGLGAVTWGSAKTGVSGVVSASNSLVGAVTGDAVGWNGVVALSNGNYVVISRFNAGPAPGMGSVTWANGSTGLAGMVTTSNSIYSTDPSEGAVDVIHPLANGNFVVTAQAALGGKGAVRWVNGSTGAVGPHTIQNSLVGAKHGDMTAVGVFALTNGNYVVTSPHWSNGSIAAAGAATWANGATGITGLVGPQISLVGGLAYNYVGVGGVTALTNGNYVVKSFDWEEASRNDQGAVTWGDGSKGVTGVVSTNNSLVGTNDYEYLGDTPFYESAVTPLANGHYVVSNVWWDDGNLDDVGAVRWADGTQPTRGFLERSNSLIGTAQDQKVSNLGVTSLTNGHYVIETGGWSGLGENAIGAATWADGTRVTSGIVSAANSITGGQPGDLWVEAYPLPDGNFVLSCPQWDKGAVANAGASMWVDGSKGSSGVLLQFNSMIGSSQIDFYGFPYALSDSSYLLASQHWDNGVMPNAGIVTWASGKGNTVGVASASNSLVGTSSSDSISDGGLIPLADGFFLFASHNWDLSFETFNSSAVSLGRAGPLSGGLSASNSVLGTLPSYGTRGSGAFPGLFFDYDESRQRLVVGRPGANAVSLFSLDNDVVFTSGFETRRITCKFGDWGCGRR